MQVPESMPEGRGGNTTSGSGTRGCAHAGGTVQFRKERKENGENQRKTQLLRDDVGMSGRGVPSIPTPRVHAMRHEWLEAG